MGKNNYIITLTNIAIAMTIWVLPAILTREVPLLFITWIVALMVYKELDDNK